MVRFSIMVMIGGVLAATAAGQVPATSSRPASKLPSVPTTQPAGAGRTPTSRPVTGSVKLTDVCPIVCRGTALKDALAELSDRLGVRYILDSSIPQAILDEPVRISALYLTGEQAFRWLARMGGVTAVLVDGIFLVAPDDRLPAVWRATGTGSASQRASDEARWARVNGRRADVSWVDTPMTGLAEDISTMFRVDVVFHPALLADPKLIYMKDTGVSLNAVREVLAQQLDARTEFYDGALWVCPSGEPPRWLPPTSGPGEAVVMAPEAFRTPPLDMWVGVDRSITSWVALGESLAGAAGIPCVVDAPPGTAYPGIEANGSVAEVLDGLRMVGLITWVLEPGTSSGEAKLTIAVRQKR